MRFGKPFAGMPGWIATIYVVGTFGDSPEMATELADLVMAGIKGATASLARDYGEGREPMPQPGDFAGRRRPSTVHLANQRGND
jgi:hypothetical protein